MYSEAVFQFWILNHLMLPPTAYHQDSYLFFIFASNLNYLGPFPTIPCLEVLILYALGDRTVAIITLSHSALGGRSTAQEHSRVLVCGYKVDEKSQRHREANRYGGKPVPSKNGSKLKPVSPDICSFISPHQLRVFQIVPPQEIEGSLERSSEKYS